MLRAAAMSGSCPVGASAGRGMPAGSGGWTVGQKKFKIKISLAMVKPICIGAVLLGIFFFAAGRWAAALCMLLGSYLFEKSMYRCPACGKKLDMKYPLMKGARCPFCGHILRERT